MKYSEEIFLPITISLILYFCFCPIVDKLQGFKISRLLSSVAAVLIICSTVFTGIYHLSSPIYNIFATSSEKLSNIENKLIIFKKPIADISEAEKKVDKITDADEEEVVKVQVKESSLSEDIFYQARLLAFNFITTMVVFFFLLMYGDRLFCNLSRVLPYGNESEFEGSLLSKIQNGTFQYLLTISMINIVLGFVIGTILYFLDFPNPFLWGVIAGMLNFIPYIGCLIGSGLIFIISLTSNGSSFEIVMPALSYLFINTLEGQFVTPMVLGSALRINPLIILLSLIYWGSIWGVAGLFVAIPILIVLNIIGAHSLHLKTWTEALKL